MTSTVDVDVSAPVPSVPAAEAYVASTCFKTGPPRLIGVELEWLTHDASDPALPVTAARLGQALGPHTPHPLARLLEASAAEPVITGHPLPSGSTVTVEPGGQLEISAPPHTSLTACVTSVADDLAQLRTLTGTAGLTLLGRGIDPVRPPRRILDEPRYTLMESHFANAGAGAAGRAMMGATASVQLNVDTGTNTHDRWTLLHRIGPVLVAMFANSAVYAGRVTGWRSTRQSMWTQLDASRTMAPSTVGDAADAYARFALGAQVMLQRSRDGWTAPPAGLTLRDWVTSPGGAPPTYADIDYHLTTLFPPVRARGHLEVRYLDAQTGDDWVVPTAVVAALLDDARTADLASDAAATTEGLWREAAQHALAEPRLRAAARTVMTAALDGLERIGAAASTRAAVATFAEHYTLAGRCPADDQLEREVHS